LKARAGLFAARLAELRGLDAFDLYPLAATAQRSAVDRRAPLAGENGRCAEQERDAKADRACPGEHSRILISWRVSAEGNIACARKNGGMGRKKLSSAVLAPRGQGLHSTPEGLLVGALTTGGARRICTCCSRRILQKVLRTSVSKLGLYLNDESKIVFIVVPSLILTAS
jgi:hypothetical protein